MILDRSRSYRGLAARLSRTAVLLGARILALAIAALGAGTAHAEPVRIGVSERMAAAPLHVAANRGYFEREGLEVVLTVVADGDALVEGLAEKRFDLATLGTNRLLQANATGLDLRGAYVLARSGTADALVADGDIADTRRLRGRRVAVVPDSPGDLLLRWALQRKGRRLANVEVVPIGGDAAVRALLDGDVDAAALHGLDLGAFAEDATAEGTTTERFRTLATAADTPGLVDDLLVGAEASLDTGKTVTKGVVRAIDRAIGWMRRHPEETRALLGNVDVDADTGMTRKARGVALAGALRGTAFLDVAENMDLLRGEFQKAFSRMSEVLDAGGVERAREVPSANRFLALSALRQVAAGR